MAVIKAPSKHIDMLARLLRAEAVGEGKQGMLHVGAVTVNRVRVNCSDFVGLDTLPRVINQPTAFEALQHGMYYRRARESEKRLARRSVKGERGWPARYSLWYFKPGGNCPPTWYDQSLVGKYKSHCFYEPIAGECDEIYNAR